MDVYHIWCTPEDEVGDLEFAAAVWGYFEHLKSSGLAVDYRIPRRKLGLGQAHQWHVISDFNSLTQFDSAFRQVSSPTDPVDLFTTRS